MKKVPLKLAMEKNNVLLSVTDFMNNVVSGMKGVVVVDIQQKFDGDFIVYYDIKKKDTEKKGVVSWLQKTR